MAVLADFEESPAAAKADGFDEWALVELMGHRRLAGRVTEQTIAGRGFVRIEVPEIEGQAAFTKLFGTGSVYAITPVDEPVARVVAANLQETPVEAWLMADQRRPHLAVLGPDESSNRWA